MPTYLRWIASITSGLTAYFSYSILTFGIARAQGVTELRGGIGALIAFGSFVVMLVATLGVNDWLIKRYPRAPAAAREPRERAEP